MKPLLDVLQGREPARRPIWIMRQAGRYLPEYRELRAKAGSFLGLCYDPAMAAEVTLQPLRRFDLDAAILFSDILVVPNAMGLKLDFREGEGPILQMVSDTASVAALGDGTKTPQFGKVCETVARVKAGLGSGKALIGFCGAPWTVASYMIEGGSSKRAKALAVAKANPDWFETLMAKLVEASVIYLLGQIAAGAEAIQIFDSWAGDLPEDLRQRLIFTPIAAIIKGVREKHPGFPVIAFARGVGHGHGDVARATAANAVGIEEGVSLADVLASLPKGVAVQGNLANLALLGDEAEMEAQVKQIVASVARARHIFNLGHGILPETPIARVERLVDLVRRHG